MNREEFLHLLSLSPDSETDQTEYLLDASDGTWHVVWDEGDDGRLETACGRALPNPTTDPPGEPIGCPQCAERLDFCEQIEEQNRRHFLDVNKRIPILIREDEHTWIAPDFTTLSNKAMGVLVRESVRLNAHVYALPGGGWDLVPLEAEPDLAARLMLEERSWQEIH